MQGGELGLPGSCSTLDHFNLAGGVYRFAAAEPAAPALVVDDRTYSYAELCAGARRVAGWLRSVAGSGEVPPRVGILASRSFELYAGILGVAWAGGTYVPLNPRQPPARLVSILKQAGLSALIADARAATQLQDAEVHAALPSHVLASARPPSADRAPGVASWTELSDHVAPSTPAATGPGHPAYIIFTSGTTGVPKGVVVTAASVAHFLGAMRSLYAMHPGDRVGQFCEASFDLSVFEIFAAWDAGASLHVVPESRLMAPAGFIRQQQLTVWASVPSVIAILSRMKLLESGLFPTLRVSFFIGEALSVEAARAWQAAAPRSVVDNHYGPTEATVACTVQRLTDPVVETAGRGTMAIGQPYAGIEADIVGADGAFLGVGETGELALHGPQVAAGYLDDAEQTTRRFPLLDHPRLGVTRWYLTGDVAYRDEREILHCLGRIDNQVKIRGHRVELEDLEAHLRAASGSDAVATVAWPIVNGNATGIAAFVCGSTTALPDIRQRLMGLVPPYMVPRQLRAIDALPLSANGKVDRKALRAMLDEER